MVARLIKWADRSDSPTELAAFFSMVDRRKALHRRACEWSAGNSEIFLSGQIPYASIVEQMAVRRMPLPVFAARDSATAAFAGIWSEVETRLERREQASSRPRDRWVLLLRAIESLIARLEAFSGQELDGTRQSSIDVADRRTIPRCTTVHGEQREDPQNKRGSGLVIEHDSSAEDEVHFVHSFDTDGSDLRRCGYVLELREGPDRLVVVAARSGAGKDDTDSAGRTHARIDSWWATQILSGMMSPLTALERRFVSPRPVLVENLRAIVRGEKLRRIESRAGSLET
jgi:hypothetical protein